MKKVLWISNIITLGALIIIGLHYKIPKKIYNKIFNSTVVKNNFEVSTKLKCQYKLTYFDFHYKKESLSPNIIMFGNSIIRHGKWDDLLERQDVINRGISGDNLPCMCERLKYLKNKNAKIWFIEGGINDLPHKTPISLFENYKSIIEFVKSENAIPVINLVFYLSPKAGLKFPSRADYKKINSLITELNDMLIDYAIKNNIDYINLNKIISGKDNVLKEEYTSDGVHLTEKAYKEWSKMIEEILVKYKI